MTARNIMTAPALTLRLEDSVATAAQHLVEHRFISLPVVDADRRYLGLFGIFELLELLLPPGALVENAGLDLDFIAEDTKELHQRMENARARKIADVYRKDLPTLKPDTPLLATIHLFHRTRRTLPVVDAAGKLVGIVSYWDALAALLARRHA